MLSPVLGIICSPCMLTFALNCDRGHELCSQAVPQMRTDETHTM